MAGRCSDLTYYALNKKGDFGAARMYELPPAYLAEFPDRDKFSVANADGARHETATFLYKNTETPVSMLEQMQKQIERRQSEKQE